ncbi:uncharacterized protein [Amphiura filiformis]|uniref:uncharacterized protein n=1 Tax=Amphiura filiformis TaxID=82378 RepID=UPI003B21C42A
MDGWTPAMATNVNECHHDDACDINTICVNQPGTYTCLCQDGYSRENDRSCLDIDECQDPSSCDVNADCENHLGYYSCSCPAGFHGNGHICEDINECSSGIAECDTVNAMCINLPRSYQCACKNGYLGDGITCQDINECSARNSSSHCDVNAECINAYGSYGCKCKSGFIGNGKYCDDINECTLGTHGCDVFSSVCVNTEGSYSCYCKTGNEENLQGYCVDINECQLSSHLCGEGATCYNTQGSHYCLCPVGKLSTSDHKACIDDDECETGRNSCPITAKCFNTYGSYECACRNGFEGDGINCIDIDECSLNPSLCPIGDCVNQLGSYICVCGNGYIQIGHECIDINECLQPEGSAFVATCPLNSVCTNMQPLYSCDCMEGYERDGDHCVDINECLTTGTCHPNATCINLQGSHQCQCQHGYYGYQGDGHQCKDVNECIDPSICGKWGTCVNLEGSYSCECPDGFRQNEDNICEDIDECSVSHQACDHDLAVCVNVAGGYQCQCQHGYKVVRHNGASKCVDINECELDYCSPDATCENTQGSFSCSCNLGYYGDGRMCQAVCQHDICRPNQVCVVTELNIPQCICGCLDDTCPTIPGIVCGSNGQTYESEADMYLYNCEMDELVTVEYRGPCVVDCSQHTCRLGAECQMTNGTAKCVCPICQTDDDTSGPVCGSNGVTYESLCELNQFVCESRQLVQAVSDSECSNDCTVSEWSDWSECSVTCGSGVKDRSRYVIQDKQEGSTPCPDLEHTVLCSLDTCAGSLCEDIDCPYGSNCIVGEGNFPHCECPDCSDLELNPVCGSDQRTYRSACHMMRVACRYGRRIAVVREGGCDQGDIGGEPLHCSVMEHFVNITSDDNQCSTPGVIDVGLCDGGCGVLSSYCCEATVIRAFSVNMSCMNGTQITKEYGVIDQCDCTCIIDEDDATPIPSQ